MTLLLWNVLLALAWTALTGRVSVSNFLEGFVLSYVILFLSRRIVGPSTYFRKVGQLLGLTLYFIWELVLANLRVAYDVLTPRHKMRPGVVAIPLDAESDAEITLLANLITLTPGTLSLDVSKDRKMLYIHAMYIDDIDQLRRKIKDGFERRVLEVLR